MKYKTVTIMVSVLLKPLSFEEKLRNYFRILFTFQQLILSKKSKTAFTIFSTEFLKK